MTATTPAFDLTVSRVIPAEPQALYAIVTEVGRMGELSPETRSTQWVEGDGPVVGARFKGRNKLGWLSWTTIATVTEAEPGARFAFEISPPSR
ncbi:MAG: SRPBCC family protein, partial [Nocardioides sp.]